MTHGLGALVALLFSLPDNSPINDIIDLVQIGGIIGGERLIFIRKIVEFKCD